MPTIYGPQAWPDSFSYPSYYQSSNHGGGDAPNTDYLELAAAENVEVVAGAGPSGEHVVDAVDTGDYTTAGIALTAVGDGSLATSQYDARGLHVRWHHKLLASGLAEAGVGQLVVLTHGGPAGTDPGLSSSGAFLAIEAQQTSGATFEWTLRRRRFTGSSSGSGTSLNPGIVLGTDTADDAWHELEVVLTPSTVTGAFAGDGTLGSAVVASDGAISVYVDGVLLSTQSGLNFVINYRATTTPEVYYGRGVWHGFADLLGPVTNTWLFTEDDEPPPEYEPIENVSEPCCGDGTDGAPPATGVTGEIPKVNPFGPRQSWASTTTCVGEGTVPTAADLTDTEDWRTLLGPTPNMLCELHATQHPDTLGSTTYRWADQGLDLPAESAFVEGRVRKSGWSEIRRAMALPDQYPEVSRAGVTIDEQDALIRTLLDTDSTAYLVAREWVSWLVSEVGRKASTAMRVAFRGVVSALNPGPGRTYTIEVEDQITSPFGVFDLDKLLPQAVIDYAFFGPGGDDGTDIHPVRYGGEFAGQLTRGVHKDLIGTPIPILGGICSDRGALSIDNQSAEKGAVPLIWVRDCYVSPHLDQLWGELLVCLGEVAGIEDVFASDLGYDGPTTPTPRRASKRININATASVDLLCPGMTGWPFAETYRERTVNGHTLRYTAVYLRGPRMEEHRQGLCTVTANVCGPMGENDQVIDQAGPFLQWFYNEHVAKDEGRGYRAGDYHTLETYASDATVPYLQPTTFDAFQEYSKDRLGNDVGYLVTNFQLREQVTLRELEKRFMQDFEVSLPFNHFGQKFVAWIDDLADPTTGTLYRERIEIDEPLPPYRDEHGELENRVGFVCDYDHDLKEWRREPEFLQDDNSIEAHRGIYQGGKRLADGQTPQPIEVFSTGDIDTVRDVFARRQLRKRKAPRYQEIPSDLAALHDEIGSQVRLTHSRGVGANGYVERPFFVLEQRHDPNRHSVMLRAMDLEALVYGVGGWTEDADPDWDGSSAAQRVANSFWAADDGTIPSDDVPAKEWR